MVIIWLMMVNNNLVGGFNLSEKILVNGNDDIPDIFMENKKCLKPPTRIVWENYLGIHY